MKTLAAVAIAAAALAAAAGAATTLTLTASAPVVAYGKSVTATGQLPTQKANQAVAIQATACGSTRSTKVATVRTTANGTYTASLTPTVNTAYQATSKNLRSATVTVSVKPLLQLSRVARGTFTAKVTAAQALTGKLVLFQRWSRLRKRWVQVKRVTLGAAVAGATKPTMVTSARFKAKVRRGVRVRVLLSKTQAAPCYVKAASASIRA